MDAKLKLYEKIKDGTFALMTGGTIANKLHLNRKQTGALYKMLDSLCAEKDILRDASFRYGTAEQFCAVTGTLTGNERGFGFVVRDDGGDDLFIPRRAMNNALHGDKVIAFSVGGRAGDEGEILKVLSHGLKEIVGTFHTSGRGDGTLRPDERKFSEDIRIPFSVSNGCQNGQKAVARLTSAAGCPPVGRIVEILGMSGDFLVEEQALIRARNLREEFPENVVCVAEEQARRPVSDFTGRVDLTQELIITVDGEDTRDIDDAISLRQDGDKFYLGVHIADVSHYVKKGGEIDKEAYARGTSVYFPDRVLPMLPTPLSNGICSLNEGELRYALSCFMTVSQTGKVLERRFAPSVIRSRHRMTYTEITAIYEGDKKTRKKYPDLIEFVDTAIHLTKILKRAREDKGGVSLDVKEAKILYENGKVSIPDYDRSISHEMIEQFMVLANESVATLMHEAQMPFVYRVHERPSPDKAKDFALFLNDLGISAKYNIEDVKPSDYRKVLLSVRDLPVSPIVSRVMLRSMMKASYSPENMGHFGLASDCYCHFTSPIRRYPDLTVHRILKGFLCDKEKTKEKFTEFVKQASVQSSATEKNAESAEREVDALYIVKYMSDKIGEEYDAVISGVTSFGIFAELKNTVEGMIPLDVLPDDGYDYRPDKFLLRGTRNSFRLGDEIRVKVASVDWGSRRTLFVLADDFPKNVKEKRK